MYCRCLCLLQLPSPASAELSPEPRWSHWPKRHEEIAGAVADDLAAKDIGEGFDTKDSRNGVGVGVSVGALPVRCLDESDGGADDGPDEEAADYSSSDSNSSCSSSSSGRRGGRSSGSSGDKPSGGAGR